MNLKQLWSIIRGRRTNFSWMNASWTYYPDGDPLGKILLRKSSPVNEMQVAAKMTSHEHFMGNCEGGFPLIAFEDECRLKLKIKN